MTSASQIDYCSFDGLPWSSTPTKSLRANSPTVYILLFNYPNDLRLIEKFSFYKQRKTGNNKQNIGDFHKQLTAHFFIKYAAYDHT